MTTGANNFALDIANDRYYKAISNGPVQTAVLTIATQLSTYRFQATAAAAVAVLRDLIEDILRGQGGQVVENVLPPAANAELLISDATAQTALGTIRTYLTGLSNAAVPAIGALPAKRSFDGLCKLIVESI
jgi:hypothetical protein